MFSISVVTASVNTNVGATSATSADSVSAFTGSVSTDAGVVSAISAISVSIVNASVNADVPFSVVSILKLPIPTLSDTITVIISPRSTFHVLLGI